MKYLLAVAITAITLSIVPAQPVSANALEVTETSNVSFLDLFVQDYPLGVATLTKTENQKPETELVEKEPEPTEYIVKDGDNLSKIAKKFDTTWVRLWNANEKLKNQDVISVGDKLIIPDAEEKLKDRAFYVAPVVIAPVITAQTSIASARTAQTSPVAQTPATQPVRSYSSGGNTYGYGYCTWYVKNRRPDLPNGLGNANTWYSRASGFGLATGSTPRAGAVGTTTRGSLGHVVYVEAVHGNGTITISDMNYGGWNVVTTRTVNANEFLYIY